MLSYFAFLQSERLIGELIIFLATSLVFMTKALDSCPASTANKEAMIFKQLTLATEHGITLKLNN